MNEHGAIVPGAAPHVVATGFTTAYLGDERSLREFVVGDHVVRSMRARGQSAVLYLVNDTYDPLDPRQLRVGVNKDEALIRRFEPFCGKPIAEVPDPFECHASYADHFLQAWLDRLDALDIHPVVLDTWRAYRSGGYAPFVRTLFDRYDEIATSLAERFEGLGRRDLFRLQCPRCSCLDSTEIRDLVAGEVSYHCRRCGAGGRRACDEVQGKLSWKLDCAARWNLYRIDTETFAKEHQAALGTFNVSRFVSKQFFGGRVPATVKYGALHVDPALTGRLLQMLPAAVFKGMLTEHLSRDVELTPESVRHFCTQFEIEPGTSYVDFVRRELPRRAIETQRAYGDAGEQPGARTQGLRGRALIHHANRFSEFYWGKTHGVRLPSAKALAGVPAGVLELAREVVAYALETREGTADVAQVKERLRAWLASRPSAPGVYPFLRDLFGQVDGPNVTTMLAILPRDYLETIHLVLDGAVRAVPSQENDPERARKRAA